MMRIDREERAFGGKMRKKKQWQGVRESDRQKAGVVQS